MSCKPGLKLLQMRIILIYIGFRTVRNAACTSDKLSIHDFCRGGQLLLWASRQWMRAYRQRRNIAPCVWQSFACAGLHRAYAELCRILAVLAFREFPADGFGAPDQALLTADESAFMRMFCAIEDSDIPCAMDVMCGRSSPAVTRTILRRSACLIIELHRQGQRVECRRTSRAPSSLRIHEPVSSACTVH